MDALRDDYEIEIDESVDEITTEARPAPTIIKVPPKIRRHRYITYALIGHANPRTRSSMAAAKLNGELDTKPNIASVCREFGIYPRAVKAELAALRGSNRSIPEKPLETAWRCASQADQADFVATNATALVTANANAIMAALDRVTTP